jgi:hypothetical protein
VRLERIVTLANAKVRLRFLAMERSLRAVGCELPLWVIPYDDDLFDLPANSTWWRVPAVHDWLRARNSHRMMAKYACLTIDNYQFVDSDIVFLRDPAEVLRPWEGFIASCGQWRDSGQAVSPESRRHFERHCTLWQKLVFNAGQFACDRQLFEAERLIETASRPDLAPICLQHPSDSFYVNDQTGLNMLVLESGVPVVNLNLPPSDMESTWAGDYRESDFDRYWHPPVRKPYLIHWAGIDMSSPRPLNELFYQYLTTKERREWDEMEHTRVQRARGWRAAGQNLKGRIRRAGKAFLSE